MEQAQIHFAADTAAAALHHGATSPAPFRNDPGIGFVEPVIVKTTASPAGGTGIAQLQIGLSTQHAAQAGEANAFAGSLTEQFRQEAGTFEPPMAKEFSVKRCHQQGFDGHAGLQPIQLLASAL